ncbi:hypothetical protein [Lacinutrix salivirga]
MEWKKLVIICLLLSCISCISFYRHPEGGFRPKKPKFSLDKEVFNFNNKIDTLAIYTKTDTLKYGKYKSVFYFKFYNNGRYFENGFKPNVGINKSNLYPTTIGYYNTYNDSIKLEFFWIDATNVYDTEYVLLNGIIKGDTLIFDNRFVKGDKDIYIKQKLDFIPKPSNW